MDVLHEFYVDQRLTGRILKRNLQSFIGIMVLSAIAFIGAFLTISPKRGQEVIDRIAFLQAPLSDLVGLSTMAQLIVLVIIVVLGIMGASVSGLMAISRQLHRSRIPEQAGTAWFAAARLATGGIAGLMLFRVLRTTAPPGRRVDRGGARERPHGTRTDRIAAAGRPGAPLYPPSAGTAAIAVRSRPPEGTLGTTGKTSHSRAVQLLI